MKKISSALATAIVTFFCSHSTVEAQNALPKIIDTYHIASSGTWDFLSVGPGNGKLYVSHQMQVNILDLKTGDSLGFIPNTMGVHGIAFDKSGKKGYASNGKTNNVTVFDLETNNVITHIATGEKPDVIFYEPFSNKILACNGISNTISVIDPETDAVVNTITLPGKPEAAVSNEEGKIYVDIEDKNEITVIDMNSYNIISHFALAPGEEPAGLAIDKKTKRLFAGCGNKMLVVVDAMSGKVLNHFAIGDDCDGVVFDNTSKTIYAANGEDGTVTAVKEISANTFKLLGNVVTKKGARTICIDQATHKLYLPTADLEKTIAEGAKRPAMIPGTFQVLVLK